MVLTDAGNSKEKELKLKNSKPQKLPPLPRRKRKKPAGLLKSHNPSS